MKKFILAVTALTAFSAAPALADEGFYVGALGGYVWNNNQAFKDSGTKYTVTLDGGYDVSVFGGYNFGSVGTAGSARGEVQYSYREADVNDVKVNGSKANAGGTYTESGLFFNGYYDFDQSGAPLVPYVGAGVGYGRVNFDNYAAGGNVVLDKGDDLWSYQLIAGAGYNINPTTRVFADYRFRSWQETDVTARNGSSAKITPQSSSLNVGVLIAF